MMLPDFVHSFQLKLKDALQCLVDLPIHSFFLFYRFLPAYAFAELIDNSLAATARNEGARDIEIRLVSITVKHGRLQSTSSKLSVGTAGDFSRQLDLPSFLCKGI